MTVQSDESPVHKTKETCDISFTTDLLEQYKLYVQSAESVSSRRVATSCYLLTLSAALVALYGLQPSSLNQSYWILLVLPVMGIFVSLLWYQIIKSHSKLNSVKFTIINELEQHLPAALFSREWQRAEQGHGKSYTAATTIERWIPLLFIFLHVAFAVILASAGADIMGWVK